MKSPERQLDILRKVTQAMIAGQTVEDIVQLILDLTLKFMRAKIGSIFLVDELRNELYIKAAKGLPDDVVRAFRPQIGQGISGWVAKHKKPLLIRDIEKDKRFRRISDPKYETHSLLSVPIIMEEKVLGVLNVNNKLDKGAFTRDELNLLSVLANHAALAFTHILHLDQIRTQQQQLQAINRRLVEADRLKSEFISRASHELRTPLNSILGAVYYLTHTKLSLPQGSQAYMDIIARESQRLLGILNDLLEFLHLGDERRILRKSPLDLTQILKEVLAKREISTLITARHQRVELASPDNPTVLLGDPTRIANLLFLLVEHALSMARSNHPVDAHIAEQAETVTLTLEFFLHTSRVGQKISLRPFDTDRQGEFSKEATRTAAIRRLADLHEGTIEMHTLGSQKAQFNLILPKSTPQASKAIQQELLDLSLTLTSEILQVDISSVMLVEEDDELVIRSARGLDLDVITRTRLRKGTSIAGWVALEGKPLLVKDIERFGPYRRKNIPQYTNNSLLSLPVKVDERVVGVVNLNNKRDGSTFNEEDLLMAQVLVNQIGHLMREFEHVAENQPVLGRFIEPISNLVTAAQYCTPERLYHACHYSIQLGRALKLSETQLHDLLLAAMLYDLGMAGMKGMPWRKREQLTAEEILQVKTHPDLALHLITPLQINELTRTIIRHHHERFDGNGYPDGLAGENIPMGSRILAVIDAYLAMTNPRIHRQTMTSEEAAQELRQCAGTHFDPTVVEAFLQIIDQSFNL